MVNNLIDLKAKEAAELHKHTSNVLMQEVEQAPSLAKAMCALAAKLLPLFPARERGSRHSSSFVSARLTWHWAMAGKSNLCSR